MLSDTEVYVVQPLRIFATSASCVKEELAIDSTLCIGTRHNRRNLFTPNFAHRPDLVGGRWRAYCASDFQDQ